MLNAQMTVNLPSVETTRQMGPLEWLQALFGKTIDLRSGAEELTMSAFALLQALYEALRKAGVSDAIALLVDKKVVYADHEEVDDDLGLILQAAESAGLFTRRFQEMHLALAHRDHGLHTILDIKIHSHVLRGDDEMRVMLSGRIESLRIAEGENAAAYAERVRAFGEQPEAIEEYRRLLDALQERLGDALRMAIPGAEVHSTPAQVSLIWPDDRNIARFRQLHFGEAIDEPRYRPVPTRQRYGAYNDPYYLYYHDPYYDLTNWLLLDSLFRRPTWSASTVHVVHGDGTMVDMQQHPSTAASAWASEIVQFDATGALHVSDTIADTWGGAEVAEASRWGSVEVETDSTENRWGGSDVSVVDTSSAGWGGSDVSGTSSSCGSSCSASSGSSCGSSCSSSC